MSDLPETALPANVAAQRPEVHSEGAPVRAEGIPQASVREVPSVANSGLGAFDGYDRLPAAGLRKVRIAGENGDDLRGYAAQKAKSASYLSGLVDHTRVDQCDAESWLRDLPVVCDLIFGSPPYTNSRTYKENGKTVPMFKDARVWALWMADIYELCLEKCRGLVAFVVAGRTRKFSYNAAPHLLVAELSRRGVNLRNPCIFHRHGISGSGGPDYFRSDYEHIVVASNAGKLPWSNNTATGHVPKYAPGGSMSHRLSNGSRRGVWGGTAKSGSEMRPNGKRNPPRGDDGLTKVGEVTPGYKPPKIANPGNVFHVPVGGGRMGHRLAHQNEAPFPEGIVKPFVLSFCPPGGIVGDPFAGSGTTLAVAKKFGRIGIGCDIRDSQCDIARERLASVVWQEGLQ